jgi:hypothetical protein
LMCLHHKGYHGLLQQKVKHVSSSILLTTFLLAPGIYCTHQIQVIHTIRLSTLSQKKHFKVFPGVLVHLSSSVVYGNNAI